MLSYFWSLIPSAVKFLSRSFKILLHWNITTQKSTYTAYVISDDLLKYLAVAGSLSTAVKPSNLTEVQLFNSYFQTACASAYKIMLDDNVLY